MEAGTWPTGGYIMTRTYLQGALLGRIEWKLSKIKITPFRRIIIIIII